jgi:hypothetical protein
MLSKVNPSHTELRWRERSFSLDEPPVLYRSYDLPVRGKRVRHGAVAISTLLRFVSRGKSPRRVKRAAERWGVSVRSGKADTCKGWLAESGVVAKLTKHRKRVQ